MGSPAYDKQNCTRVNLKLNNKTDADIISQLEKQESIQGYIKDLIRRDVKMNRNIINFLNRHSEELFNGQKVTGYDRVFWANMTTREIYAHSTDAEILGSINGYKVADITDNWQIDGEKKMWYAVLINREDDWGTGSYSKEEAIRMAREQLAEYPDTLIAVIDNSTSNPVCVDEITDFE